MFFRAYSQGIYLYYNRFLRSEHDSHEYFKDSSFGTEITILNVIEEMKQHAVQEDIYVYRYLDKRLLKQMLAWPEQRTMKKNILFWDKGFLSTTLTPEVVKGCHKYTSWKNEVLKIRVIKGTPCIFLELISDMNENEMLFSPCTKLRVLKGNCLLKEIECEVDI